MPSPSRRAEADRYYLLHRAIQVLGAGLLALLATLKLTPVEAGLFFTLGAVLGAQVLLDAGSSTLIITGLGRAMRHARWDAGRLLGPPVTLRRVGWLSRYAIGWGVASALVALLVLMPAALWLLGKRPEIDALPNWQALSLATMVGLALSQLGSAVPIALEGTGQVARVARLRAAQDAVAYAAACAAAMAGHGLASLAVLWGLRGLIGVAWSIGAATPLLAAGRSRAWRRHLRSLAPTQWRLAGSWAAGYLSQQTMVPVAYALLGPAAAARLGLAFFCTSGLLMVATAWAAARMPEFARLGAARLWSMFDVRLARVLQASTASAFGGGLLLLAGLLAVQGMTIATRLPQLLALTLLVAAATASAAIHALATALRACGGEPFLVPTLVGGLLMPPALLVGAWLGGESGLCAAYFALNVVLGVPWAWWLLARQRADRTGQAWGGST